MRKVRDMLTPDMFEVPVQASKATGSLAKREHIAGIMSDVIRDCDLDRYQIAAEMSRLLGREITKYMLDAYTSESRETHIPPLDTAIAFDVVTGGISLLKFFADLLGCSVLVGDEILLAELGRIGHIEADLAIQKKAIKKRLGAV